MCERVKVASLQVDTTDPRHNNVYWNTVFCTISHTTQKRRPILTFWPLSSRRSIDSYVTDIHHRDVNRKMCLIIIILAGCCLITFFIDFMEQYIFPDKSTLWIKFRHYIVCDKKYPVCELLHFSEIDVCLNNHKDSAVINITIPLR